MGAVVHHFKGTIGGGLRPLPWQMEGTFDYTVFFFKSSDSTLIAFTHAQLMSNQNTAKKSSASK